MSQEEVQRKLEIQIHIEKQTHRPFILLSLQDVTALIPATEAIGIAVAMMDAAITARARAAVCQMATRTGMPEAGVPQLLEDMRNMQAHMDAFAQGNVEQLDKTEEKPNEPEPRN